MPVQRACRVVRLSRTAYYQPPVPASRRDAAVIAALTDAVARYPRWGFWKLHDRLRAEGRPWNHKRLHRVYCALRLNLPRRTTRRVPRRVRQPLTAPPVLNRTWALDFMTETLYDRRRIRLPRGSVVVLLLGATSLAGAQPKATGRRCRGRLFRPSGPLIGKIRTWSGFMAQMLALYSQPLTGHGSPLSASARSAASLPVRARLPTAPRWRARRGGTAPRHGAPAERTGLQLGESVAAARAADAHRPLVAHQPAAAPRQDRRALGEACPLLLAAAGRESPDPTAVRIDASSESRPCPSRPADGLVHEERQAEARRQSGEVSENAGEPSRFGWIPGRDGFRLWDAGGWMASRPGLSTTGATRESSAARSTATRVTLSSSANPADRRSSS